MTDKKGILPPSFYSVRSHKSSESSENPKSSYIFIDEGGLLKDKNEISYKGSTFNKLDSDDVNNLFDDLCRRYPNSHYCKNFNKALVINNNGEAFAIIDKKSNFYKLPYLIPSDDVNILHEYGGISILEGIDEESKKDIQKIRRENLEVASNKDIKHLENEIDSLKDEISKDKNQLFNEIRKGKKLTIVKQCEKGEYYDIDTKSCKKGKSVSFIDDIKKTQNLKKIELCPDGTYWDSKNGECIEEKAGDITLLDEIKIGTELKKVCPNGYYWNSKTQECLVIDTSQIDVYDNLQQNIENVITQRRQSIEPDNEDDNEEEYNWDD